MFTQKEEFTYQEIEGYFKDKVFLNFMNEMMIEMNELYEWTMIHKMNYSDAYFNDRVPDA